MDLILQFPPIRKIEFDVNVDDLSEIKINKLYSFQLADMYKVMRNELEDILGRIHKPLLEEVFSQAWSPCISELKKELLSYNSVVTDGIAEALFEKIKDQRKYDGYYLHFSRKEAKIEHKTKAK